jgi:hypothetical protein
MRSGTLPPLALLLLAGCGDERLAPLVEPTYISPEEHCEPSSLAEPERFAPCNSGSGIFGEWQLDELGLPAYLYGLDQRRDARAGYPVTERAPDGSELDPREHWAAFGNRRINAMFLNDGMIEVVTQDRGVEFLDKLDLAQSNLAGGFGYLDDGESSWSTAYRWRPAFATTSRRFGMGWAESVIEHHGIEVTRVTAAPPGDAPAVISEVVIHNRDTVSRHLRHYELWDVGRRPIEINWVVSGKVLPNAPESARRGRDERNAMFSEQVRFDPQRRALLLERQLQTGEPPPLPDEASAVDYYPGAPFLAALEGQVSDAYVDQASFLGQGGPRHPDAVSQRAAGVLPTPTTAWQGAPISGAGQPHVFVLRSDVSLAPGQSRRLRFAYGYAPWGESQTAVIDDLAGSEDARDAYADHMRARMFHFAAARDPALHREMAWHSYQLETSVGRRDYWDGYVVPQGSAYLYLHGADGAARDLGLFAVPLSYTDPELAKQELKLYMGIQKTDGSFSYAFQGHGMIDDAGIHSAPSDLSLFFAWALGEYLGATGDLALLDETVPLYPREAQPSISGYDHLVLALRNLFDVVSTGEHGLIRVQTGDWSDGIVVAAADRDLAVAAGESIPNTQMAVAVLPRIADLVEPRDATLAEEIRDHVDAYRDALVDQTDGTFFYRAYYGDGEPVDADDINLESQVWALIGDTVNSDAQRTALIEAVARDLDDPSPVGATLWRGGEVWPAISALLTWGYARHDPERAWAHLSRNTMTSHARAFPEVWYGIWSGPDGLSSNSGLAWASEVTPMKDFPVQNNNQHAMPILAALRVAGVDADADGARIALPSASEPFALSCQLLDVRFEPPTLTVRYRPSGTSARKLRVVAPAGRRIVQAGYDGTLVTSNEQSVVVEAAPDATLTVSFAP